MVDGFRVSVTEEECPKPLPDRRQRFKAFFATAVAPHGALKGEIFFSNSGFRVDSLRPP